MASGPPGEWLCSFAPERVRAAGRPVARVRDRTFAHCDGAFEDARHTAAIDAGGQRAMARSAEAPRLLRSWPPPAADSEIAPVSPKSIAQHLHRSHADVGGDVAVVVAGDTGAKTTGRDGSPRSSERADQRQCRNGHSGSSRGVSFTTLSAPWSCIYWTVPSRWPHERSKFD